VCISTGGSHYEAHHPNAPPCAQRDQKVGLSTPGGKNGWQVAVILWSRFLQKDSSNHPQHDGSHDQKLALNPPVSKDPRALGNFIRDSRHPAQQHVETACPDFDGGTLSGAPKRYCWITRRRAINRLKLQKVRKLP
jgi:hypothetical protein